MDNSPVEEGLLLHGPVIGLDLSLTASGVVVSTPAGEIHPQTLPRGRPKAKGHDRLVALHAQLEDMLWLHFPTFAVIEDLPVGAHGSGRTGMAHGVVRRLLRTHEIPFSLVVPSTLKKCATGDGRADKTAMRLALSGVANDVLNNTDEVDAYWLAQVGRYYMGWDHELRVTSNLKELKLQE